MMPGIPSGRSKEYRIVIGTERQVEVYRRPENGLFQEKRLYRQNEEIVCSILPGLRLYVLSAQEYPKCLAVLPHVCFCFSTRPVLNGKLAACR